MTASMTSFSYFLKGVQSNDCCCSTKMADKSQPECFEIVPNRKGKANIWEHFGFIKEPDKPPATSVPAERVFSTAGDVVTAQRSQLKSEHVDRLILLKRNWKP